MRGSQTRRSTRERIPRGHGPFDQREELVAHAQKATVRPVRAKRSKSHHYIPEFLQKHFCDTDGKLWYGIRNTKKVTRMLPRNAFYENNLYTSYKNAHERSEDIAYEPDDGFERRFAEGIENRAAPAIERLIAGTRHLVSSGSTDLLDRLSSAEITTCKQLLISSMNRTPDAIESAIVRSGARSNQAIWKLVRKELGRFPKPVQDEFFHRYLRSAAVDVASSSHRDVPGGIDLNGCGLVVAAYSSPTRRFILGSCGLAVLPKAKDDLGGDWLPISPDQAIGLHDDPGNLRLHMDWKGLCRRINEALAKRSKWIAGESEGLVKRMLEPSSAA
ncbi:MAG: DUF4238 domain-containing protein [Gemmatimonadales bacterium]|nr:DUF4238 domain-containing protein [Gemmatimonadales bacterium]